MGREKDNLMFIFQKKFKQPKIVQWYAKHEKKW